MNKFLKGCLWGLIFSVLVCIVYNFLIHVVIGSYITFILLVYALLPVSIIISLPVLFLSFFKISVVSIVAAAGFTNQLTIVYPFVIFFYTLLFGITAYLMHIARTKFPAAQIVIPRIYGLVFVLLIVVWIGYLYFFK